MSQAQGVEPFVGAVTDKKPTDHRRPRHAWKDNKCKGKSTSAQGKGKGKTSKDYKGKGTNHKGLGKDPTRSEAVRFGGKCNWCMRIGHKEDHYWFKKAYHEWEKQYGS